jgi:hypothetical protein
MLVLLLVLWLLLGWAVYDGLCQVLARRILRKRMRARIGRQWKRIR